ncbi:hypothetical protein CPAV1605_529 [seawater metagenome]|uniref:Uncharacterized protein n=1 Tax=seawater metagenome TaxID=1561972 RepID=A0A5E8CJJ8_9ZZZZ
MSNTGYNFSMIDKNPKINKKTFDKKVTEYVIKIDSKDRDINNYLDPFSFKVRFNASGDSGSTPVIFARYNNIKYIKLYEAIIPRYNISQFYNGIDTDLFNNCLIRSGSVIRTKKRVEDKIEKGGFVIIGNQNIEVLEHIIFDDEDRLILKEFPNSLFPIMKYNDKEYKIEIINDRRTLDLIFVNNYTIDLDVLEENDLIVLENELNEIEEFDLNISSIKLKHKLQYPVRSVNPIVLKPADFKYIHGSLWWSGNSLKGAEADFINYGIGSIIYLSNSNMNQPSNSFVYLKITKFISRTEVKVQKMLGNLDKFKSGSGLQTIFNNSYVNNIVDFNNSTYVLLNIDEFNNDVCKGTNPILSQAFGILFPNNETDKKLSLTGLSDKIYPVSDLQNLNKMTISFLNSSGEKIKLDFLNPSTKITDIRNPLNPVNQVLLTFKIGVMEEEFEPQSSYNPIIY